MKHKATIEETTKLAQLRLKLINDINDLSSDSYIDLKLEEMNDIYDMRNFVRTHRDCFNKDVGLIYNKEKNEARILPFRLRRDFSAKKEIKKKEACIGRLLSDSLE